MQTLHHDHHGATRVVTLTFDDPAAPVNTMSEAWLADLHEAVDRLVAQKEHIAGVILASAKESFFAGADLKRMLRAWPAGHEAVFRRTEDIKRTFRRLETLGRPVEACLAGSALGGGFELALAAHHRIAGTTRASCATHAASTPAAPSAPTWPRARRWCGRACRPRWWSRPAGRRHGGGAAGRDRRDLPGHRGGHHGTEPRRLGARGAARPAHAR